MKFTNNIIDKIMKKNDISCNYINIFFLQSRYIKSDIQLYNHIVFENEFIPKEDIDKIELLYFNSKKIKNSLISFLKLYKKHKYISYSCNTDLYLNDLDEFNDKYKIYLIENNTKYQFRISDLINYWKESLLNNETLFPKPLHLKNPHTNLKISKHNLYNIYFKLLDTGFDIPLCISAFFKSNMNLTTFQYDYYPMLKEQTIKNFMDQTNNIYEKWEQIINMLHEYRKQIKYLTFTNLFPHRLRIEVCTKLKKHLYEYLKYKFSCNPLVRKDSNKKAKQLLKKYLKDFPNFGYNRGGEVIQYIPIDERPRVTPPPPPPVVLNRRNRNRQLSPPPPIPPPPPPPPNPPVIENTIILPTIHESNQNEIINPFVPSVQIPRTPPNRDTIRRSLSLFRR